ncbi:Excalibur domain protein [Xylanimonas cellulosilytica DSM 15894]|uniref:Excalibur domain protein n=1 Tax=Xylanimonas cellulosilytica (strain DSM 15894 / JCM 12276 / CECT 5975 / KCTC 9989 / LMG 20990 / NBRC 107835 / XIL07) TaxID=446471 RepID=D1BUS2_XYLCX|nr:excalibur calcium-binding domain-containing protein [Xylanimonas cellulosilytica]ACZ29313.1 Excalibur domain protein [Xylanimonas cellulosilytica DSM 15894]
MSRRLQVTAITVGAALTLATGVGVVHSVAQRLEAERRDEAVAACEAALTDHALARDTLEVAYTDARELLLATSGLALASEKHQVLATTVESASRVRASSPPTCNANASRQDVEADTQAVRSAREAAADGSRQIGRDTVPLTEALTVFEEFVSARDALRAPVDAAEAALADSEARVLDDAVRVALATAVYGARTALGYEPTPTLTAHIDARDTAHGLREDISARKYDIQRARDAWDTEQARIEAERVEAERVAAERRRQTVISNAGLTQARVTRTIDGDTIEVEVAGQTERVRLAGINAPEVGRPGADSATAFARTAIDRAGGTVWLERSGDSRDRFNRLRRNVWLDVPTSTGNAEQRRALLLNRMLLDAGHAVVSTPARSAPRPAPSAPPRAASPAPATRAPFRNCTAVWDTLGRPIRRGEPGFHSRLDRDNDGVGCEWDPRR